ncbi:MAG: hypothetical protein JW885_15845 [Deltaproteobacteria bacterium]|nr:hypothetical protein [Candidatus Zymogenaceae bacterium]
MTTDRFMTNTAIRTMLLGVREIVGENGLKTILNRAGIPVRADDLPPNNLDISEVKISDCAKYENAIRDIYGERGARAILFNVGIAQALAGIEENSELAEATLKAFEGMENTECIRIVLATAAAGVSEQIGTEIIVSEDGDAFFYEDTVCNHCFGMSVDQPICHMARGFVYALVRWATRSDDYEAVQTKCAGMGDESCVIRVHPRMS